MSTISKKRKFQHGTDAARAAARPSRPLRADGKSESADPRFQLDSDFSYSDGEHAGEGCTNPGTATARSGRRDGAAAGLSAKQGLSVAAQHEQRGTSEDLERSPAADGDGDDDNNDVAGGEGEGFSSGEGEDAGADGTGRQAEAGSGEELQGAGGKEDGLGEQEQRRKHKKVLSKRKLERVKEASDRRGILYVSRIPPHMKPHKLRQLLEPFGDIGRVYCSPEDPALRRLRKKKGGNSGKNFTEGWVEFEDKRRAKRTAVALNGQPMGGSKRSAYHYDLWTIKYLPKFKWDTLTEEINYQRAVREQRLVAEISAAKRERDFYLSRVDKAKAMDAIQERRAKKQLEARPGGQQATAAGSAADAGDKGTPVVAAAAAVSKWGPRFERHFGQRRAKADPVSDDRAPVLAKDVLGLLGRKRKELH